MTAARAPSRTTRADGSVWDEVLLPNGRIVGITCYELPAHCPDRNPLPQPEPPPSIEERLFILESAVGIAAPEALAGARAQVADAKAVVKDTSDEQITKPLQVKP